MSRIVVIGVTGYAGGHITAELLDRGHAVVGVARDTTAVAAREGLELRPGSFYDPAFRTETTERTRSWWPCPLIRPAGRISTPSSPGCSTRWRERGLA